MRKRVGMIKILEFIKNAKEEDLELLKVLCGLLVDELERWTYDDELEEVEEVILKEMSYYE